MNIIPNKINVNLNDFVKKKGDKITVDHLGILEGIITSLNTDSQTYIDYVDERTDKNPYYEISIMDICPKVLEDIKRIAKNQDIECLRKNSISFVVGCSINVQDFIDGVDWGDINYKKVSYEFFEQFKEFIDRDNFLKGRDKTIDFDWLSKNFKEFVNNESDELTPYLDLPESFLEKHWNELDERVVAQNQKLSLDFIKKHLDDFHKLDLIEHQKIPHAMLHEFYREYSGWRRGIFENQKLTDKFVLSIVFDEDNQHGFGREDALKDAKVALKHQALKDETIEKITSYFGKSKFKYNNFNLEKTSLEFKIKNIRKIGYNRVLSRSNYDLDIVDYLISKNQKFNMESVINNIKIPKEWFLKNHKILSIDLIEKTLSYNKYPDSFWLDNKTLAKKYSAELFSEQKLKAETIQTLVGGVKRGVSPYYLTYLREENLANLDADFVVKHFNNLDTESVLYHNKNLQERHLKKLWHKIEGAYCSISSLACKKNLSKSFKAKLRKHLDC